MEDFAGILLLLLAAALTINLISGGRAGTTAWLRAKFLGRTS